MLDRNSADYTIISQAVRDQIEVVIRCPRQSLKAVMEFFQSRDKERIVKLSVPQSVRTPQVCQSEQLADRGDGQIIEIQGARMATKKSC